MSVLSLRTSQMPEDRHVPKHVSIKYDDGAAIATVRSTDEIESASLECLDTPIPGTRILLHSCCAPCSGAMIEEMVADMNLDVTIIFYNPNIHPRKEYEIRKAENVKYAVKHNIPFVDCDYDAESWFRRMNGLELEPERGVRCSACFDMRMEVVATYAVEKGFPFFTTTNATSRWKDDMQVNLAGVRAAKNLQEKFENLLVVRYFVRNWKSDVMTRRKYEISVNERFYKQEYCGCSYSLRDSNIWRLQQGIPQVKIGGELAGLGTRYFESVAVDEAEESQEVVDTFFKDANSHFGDDLRVQRQKTKLMTAQSKLGNTKIDYGDRLKSVETASVNNW
jgi:predicted adenine nucleotide alpha hydrolase (AANH) superfamily ATPase